MKAVLTTVPSQATLVYVYWIMCLIFYGSPVVERFSERKEYGGYEESQIPDLSLSKEVEGSPGSV